MVWKGLHYFDTLLLFHQGFQTLVTEGGGGLWASTYYTCTGPGENSVS